MGRFMLMVDEFKTLPPKHEIARVSILLPGDKGYPKPKIDKEQAARAVQNTIRESGKEPEWMRQRRLQEERRRAGGQHGR